MDTNLNQTTRSPDGRYRRLHMQVGTGTFKTVYRAMDEIEGKEVAWCEIRVESYEEYLNIDDGKRWDENLNKKGSKKKKKHSNREINVLNTIEHPNIIPLVGTFKIDSYFVFITELLPNNTLSDYLEEVGPLCLNLIRKWTNQLLSALDYLHERGIAHRDLKTNNIFVDAAQGVVKLGDLGTFENIKKKVVDKSKGCIKIKKKKKITRGSFSFAGTPEFMPPEVIRGCSYDCSVDIYGLGLVILEMATVFKPYQEMNSFAEIFKAKKTLIPPHSLTLVDNRCIRSVVKECIGKKKKRPTAKMLMQHHFFTGEKCESAICIDEEKVLNDIACWRIEKKIPVVKRGVEAPQNSWKSNNLVDRNIIGDKYPDDNKVEESEISTVERFVFFIENGRFEKRGATVCPHCDFIKETDFYKIMEEVEKDSSTYVDLEEPEKSKINSILQDRNHIDDMEIVAIKTIKEGYNVFIVIDANNPVENEFNETVYLSRINRVLEINGMWKTETGMYERMEAKVLKQRCHQCKCTGGLCICYECITKDILCRCERKNVFLIEGDAVKKEKKKEEKDKKSRVINVDAVSSNSVDINLSGGSEIKNEGSGIVFEIEEDSTNKGCKIIFDEECTNTAEVPQIEIIFEAKKKQKTEKTVVCMNECCNMDDECSWRRYGYDPGNENGDKKQNEKTEMEMEKIEENKNENIVEEDSNSCSCSNCNEYEYCDSNCSLCKNLSNSPKKPMVNPLLNPSRFHESTQNSKNSEDLIKNTLENIAILLENDLVPLEKSIYAKKSGTKNNRGIDGYNGFV